jgi:hypothetical protein
MLAMAEASLNYRWRKTWPDEGDRDSWETDFCGWDGETRVGRIRFEANGPMKGKWQWSGHGPDRIAARLTPHQGYEPTPRKAAAMAEDYYERLMAVNGLPFGTGRR